MASRKAHWASGVAVGMLAASIVIHKNAGGEYQILAILALLAGAWGGTAPDWMEVAWWRSKRVRGAGRLWIKHRTLTHWGIPWVMLLLYSYDALESAWWAPICFGFAAGGIMHLITDWPNPMGVPWIFRRHSLSIWRSGNFEVLIIIFSWVFCAGLTDVLIYGGEHSAWVLKFLYEAIQENTWPLAAHAKSPA